jgi:hypothetical protein
VDRDPLGGAGRHRPTPLPDLGDLAQTGLDALVAQERQTEGERVLAQLLGELVDEQLVGAGDVGRVDVAHAAGVEAHVDLAQQLGHDPEVVGQLLGQREDRLGQTEVAQAGGEL